MGWRIHRSGHRPSHAGGTRAVKILSPFGGELERQPERVGPRMFARPFRPFDQKHALPRGIETELFELRGIFDPVKIHVPHGGSSSS